MGGFVSAIGDAAEKGLTDLTAKVADTKIGRGVLSLAGNKEWELNLNPEGQAIKAQLAEYHRLKSQAMGADAQDLKAIKDWHSSVSNVRNSAPLHSTTLQDLHTAAAGHPVRQVTGRILNSDPKNAGLTLSEYSIKRLSEARLTALSGSVGDKMQNVSPLIANLLDHPDPRVQLNGQRVADIVSNEVKDTRKVTTVSAGRKSLESEAKVQINKTFNTVNKYRKASGERPIPLLNTDATATIIGANERMANDVLRMIQIPYVAIPHIGQYFHIAASAPLQSIGKALLRMDQPSMERTIEASGILANTEWDVIHSEIMARSGKVAQWTGQPTVASILQKTFHQPGFNYLRLKQLAAAGAVGFHSAQFWATNALRGDKRSLLELAEMGIDINDVKAQGGQLNEEQLTKGVYHFVNNRFFVNKSIDQALWSNSNFFMRSAFMYHSFISSETAYLRRELLKQFKAGNIKGIAQFVGTIFIVFPAVAPMLKSAELLARTGSLQQAQASMQKDYKNLTHPDTFGDFTETYLDMIAHIGAMGAAYNYTQAIKSSRLANAVVGPMIGMGLTDISDGMNAVRSILEKGYDKTNFGPLGRDATQMVPLFGKPLSHKLFPTLAERKTANENSHISTRFGRGGRRIH